MIRSVGVPGWAAVAVVGLELVGRSGVQQCTFGAQQYSEMVQMHHVPGFPSASVAELSVD